MSPRHAPRAPDAAGPEFECLSAAIDWQVRLTSGHASDSEHAAFTRWRSADVRHEAAWQRVQGVLHDAVQQIHGIDQRHPGQRQAIHRSLTATGPSSLRRRKALGGSALVLLASLGTAYLADRRQPLGGLLADLHTGTGETRHSLLPDGSVLDLSARSAADVEFDDTQRLLRLRAGELLVQVAAETAAGRDGPRPFRVQTAHGTAQALGTRFLVRREPARTLVVVLQHSVALQVGAGSPHILREGQAAWMNARDIEVQAQSMAHSADWTAGVLTVRDEALGDVVTALRPWHRGLIRVSPRAAALRVFGVFPLTDIQRALQALTDTLPLSVTQYGPFLTLIDRR